MRPTEGYSKILIEKNLKKQYGAGIKSRRGEEYLEIEDETSPIYTSHGMINKENTQKIVKIISKKTGKTEEEVLADLTKKPDFYGERTAFGLEQVVNYTILILSIGLITLILSQTKLLTGFAISNISNTISNTGIFICILGLVFLLFYKFKRK